jgi:DNA repair exonuclease SbcCD ATPase subunit
MELAEISQRLSFLDGERRKDKELVATLMERLETQTNKVEGQTRQIQELEGLLASTRAELVKFTQIERAMDQLRQELTLVIEANEEKREKSHRELTRLRQVEQDTITRQIAELRKEIKPIPRYDEEIQVLRTEIGRVNGITTSLQHQISELDRRSEDRVQSVIYLEEQRRQDNRRIAQLEGETPPLNKKIDELGDRLPLLEQAIQTKNQRIDKAAELLEEQAQVIENQRVAEFRWEREVAEWANLVEEIKKEVAAMTAQTVRLHEQHDLVRRSLADLEPFRERIERRQDEVAEMQRIAEDRQKRILEEWQAEREKEWKHFRVENEERWRENTRLNEKRDHRIGSSEEYAKMLTPQIDALWNVQEAWAQSIMVGPREWMATWDELAKQRPAMPEPLQPAPSAPPQQPKIRPLPSVQAAQEEEVGDETETEGE